MPSKFKATIDRIKNILDKNGVTIQLDMDGTSVLAQMDSMYSYDKKSKILEIVVPELGKQNKELLLQIIRKVHNDGGLLWKKTKSDTLISYTEYSTHNKYEKTLQFFSGILPKNDYSALKMSFFLRSESEKGNNIHTYKMDIRDKFGDRGANIANLCSAGYFEDEFQTLYMTIPKTEFKEYYEMVVGEKARALFVHTGMRVNDIEIEVGSLVKKAIKYHMEDFRIHGKGKTNVSHIEKFVSSRTGKEGYTMKKVFDDPKLSAIEYIVEISRDISS